MTGFKGRTGSVIPSAGDYDFSLISGTVGIAQLPNSIPASKIDGGLVTDAQFGYLNGVTGSLQTQLDGKSGLVHTQSFSSLTGLIGDSQINSGINATKIGTGSVDNAHLAYLAGSRATSRRSSTARCPRRPISTAAATWSNRRVARLARRPPLADRAWSGTAPSGLRRVSMPAR